MDSSKPEQRYIRHALDNCIRIDELLDNHLGCFALPPEVAVELRRNCFEFWQMQTALITHFQPEQKIFNYTIKSHDLLHFGMVGAYVNPILGACHQGEDLMKVAKRMVCTSAGGSGALASTKRPCRNIWGAWPWIWLELCDRQCDRKCISSVIISVHLWSCSITCHFPPSSVHVRCSGIFQSSRLTAWMGYLKDATTTSGDTSSPSYHFPQKYARSFKLIPNDPQQMQITSPNIWRMT